MNIANELLPNGLKMDGSLMPQSSAISEHSSIKGTPSDIADWLTSLPGDFRASHSASPGREKNNTTNVICGPKRGRSFASYDRDTHTWRTFQESLLHGTSVLFSASWPKSGMTANGVAYRLPPLARGTNGSACGFWPTPCVHGNHNRKGLSKNSGDGLSTAVKRYPTPSASMMTGADMIQAQYSGNDPNRPSYQDAKKRFLPTPSARDYRSPCASQTTMEKNSRPLNEVVTNGKSGALNPDWVEWLMGWPIGWTSLEPLERFEMPSWDCEPDGVPRLTEMKTNRANRIKAIGNGQVPQCMAAAWRRLRGDNHEKSMETNLPGDL